MVKIKKELRSIEFDYTEIIKNVIGKDTKYRFIKAKSSSSREAFMNNPITKVVIHIELL